MVGHSRLDHSITPVCVKLVVMSSLDAVREGVDLGDQIASKPLRQVWERESGSETTKIGCANYSSGDIQALPSKRGLCK